MIDFSHANSCKDSKRQAIVCHDVAAQVAAGNRDIIGVMIESNLVAGAQKLVPGQPLVYGQSITDACIDWDETHKLLAELAARRPRTSRAKPSRSAHKPARCFSGAAHHHRVRAHRDRMPVHALEACLGIHRRQFAHRVRVASLS